MEYAILSPASSYDFETASRAVLRLLKDRLGLDLWMVTRTEGDDWIVLQKEDSGYGVQPASVFRWADSLCSLMVAGLGPRIAPCSDAVPAFRSAPAAGQIKIGAYIGVPLTYSDGSLFGTICAIHPSPQPESIMAELPLVELLAGMLSSILNTELSHTKAERAAERAETEAETDAMTGLYNRRGWDRLLQIEEARCRRYGHLACILSIDLDRLKETNDSEGHAAGDELIRRAAQAFRMAARKSDVVARVGGDEFAILATECSHETVGPLVQRIRAGMSETDVSASIGHAMRVPAMGLEFAWKEADQAMYGEKMKSHRHRLLPGESGFGMEGETGRCGHLAQSPINH